MLRLVTQISPDTEATAGNQHDTYQSAIHTPDIETRQMLPRTALRSPTSPGRNSRDQDGHNHQTIRADLSPSDVEYPPDSAINLTETMATPADADAGPSPSEAHIAGALDQDGYLVVHGVASIFHQSTGTMAASHTVSSPSCTERKLQNQVTKARLIANAALQRQRETIIFRGSNIGQKVELDGVDVEMAIHLLDLHWNRQHYTYLISYRPAIMESLCNNGPYANKLLLNAIYLSSSLHSDRMELRSNSTDPQSAGDRFYHRFRSLLVDEVDKPSIPTAAGLLLCGATLVSQGRPSAGWILCGIAYRMIIDLGCHLTVDSRRNDTRSDMALLTDLELEMRKRLYWGAFLTDATQSLYL